MTQLESWWEPLSHAIPRGYREFIEFENAATKIAIYNAIIIPGILQTEAYARSTTQQFGSILSQTLISDRIELRMKRQWHLFERKPAPQIRVLIEESTLLRSVGGAQVQKEQLTHLVQLIEDGRVYLTITPLHNGAIWPVLGCLPFVLFETTLGSLMTTESATADDQINSHNPFEINHFYATFDNLTSRSLSPDDSLAHIKNLVAHGTNGATSPWIQASKND